MAGISKRVEAFLKKKKRVEVEVEVGESPSFVRNGGLLLEKLLSLSNGRDEVHIKRFTIQQITHSTNNFQELVKEDWNYRMYRGNLDGRPVLVVIWDEERLTRHHDWAILCTAIAAHMSHLKYILKLIGSCLDFKFPAQVYEYAGKTLYDFLGEDVDVSLSWGNRIKIARDLASVVVYLHTCFPMAIIHRDLKPSNVFIDQNGDAKLFNFCLAIQIPEGELEVEDEIRGTLGFLDPAYFRTRLVTTKSDVYPFGIILLMLLTGFQMPLLAPSDEDRIPIREYVTQFMDVDAELIDPNISEQVGMDEFRAIKDLALSCTEFTAANRPEMIDVARILHDIEKQVNKVSCRIVSPFFDYNQKALKKKLMVLSSGGHVDIPFHIYSSQEIINGTNNFQEYIVGDTYYGIKGYINGCPVFVKKWEVLEVSSHGYLRHAAVVEAAICSLMSDLKYVPKLIGCCLEFEIPCLVFEDVGSTKTLYELLFATDHSELLSWGNRLKIASDVAGVVSHLQTAFPTPIIHRDLKPSNVIISENGDAKLVGFSMAIALCPGESQVEDKFIFGTWGSLDPDYMTSNFVSRKTDVYSFGILLLALLTGMNTFWVNSEGILINIMSFVEEVISEGQIDTLVDPRILQDVKMTEFKALLDIARRCTRIKGADRPDMVDVARLLNHIEEDATRATS